MEPCCSRVKISSRFPCLLACWGIGDEWFLMQNEARDRSRGPEGLPRWSAHPFGGAVCRRQVSYSALAPDTLLLLSALWKWQLGFELFCIFLPIIFPNCTRTQLFLVPYSFFVFCCLRCLPRCQHCSHCSKGFQVPACLRSTVILIAGHRPQGLARQLL